MTILAGICFGLAAWFVVRYVLGGFYSVNQNERAVKTSFGRAQRLAGARTTLDDPIAETLRPDERDRYVYPQVRVIGPGGPYLKMPWEKVHKVSIATQTLNMALDLEDPQANAGGTMLEAVTKDQLNTGLTGADSLPGQRKQSVRLPLRGEETCRAHHGLFRQHPARAHRQLSRPNRSP